MLVVPDVGTKVVRRVIDLVYTGETMGSSNDGESLRTLLDALGIAIVLERVDETRRSNRARTLNSKYLSDEDDDVEEVPVPPKQRKKRPLPPSSVVSSSYSAMPVTENLIKAVEKKCAKAVNLPADCR